MSSSQHAVSRAITIPNPTNSSINKHGAITGSNAMESSYHQSSLCRNHSSNSLNTRLSRSPLYRTMPSPASSYKNLRSLADLTGECPRHHHSSSTPSPADSNTSSSATTPRNRTATHGQLKNSTNITNPLRDVILAYECPIYSVDPTLPLDELLKNAGVLHAASLLRHNDVVALPTETVYGLGGNALSNDAISKIYRCKGRPSDNPLIVHVATIEDVKKIAVWPLPVASKQNQQQGGGDSNTQFIGNDNDNVNDNDAKAAMLLQNIAAEFWPGPLTMVLPAKYDPTTNQQIVSSKVTAGLPSVAIRIPAHPVALAILMAANVPVAAPSANRSGKPSPTRAQHVIDDLLSVQSNRITSTSLSANSPSTVQPHDMTAKQHLMQNSYQHYVEKDERIGALVDGGSTGIGVESTVIEVTPALSTSSSNNQPLVTILRPGGITLEMLEAIAGKGNVVYDPAIEWGATGKSSNQHTYTHRRTSSEQQHIAIKQHPEEEEKQQTQQSHRPSQSDVESLHSNYKPPAHTFTPQHQHLLCDDTLNGVIPKAPGMKYTHYAPKAPLYLIDGDMTLFTRHIAHHLSKHQRVGVMCTADKQQDILRGIDIRDGRVYVSNPADRFDDVETVAANLYDSIRSFDDAQVDIIFAQMYDTSGLGSAVMNRLSKAAGMKVITVSNNHFTSAA